MSMPPTEPASNQITCQQLIENSLVDAGIVGIDEAFEQPIINRALIQINWLISQWSRKRWLVYRIQDYSVIATGAQSYTVGLGGNININPRPDRIEYGFLRFLQGVSGGGLPVDIPMHIIQSHEEYSRITVKTIGTLPWQLWYDPVWPTGLLVPWPVPQSSLYEIHVGFKVVLPRFTSLTQVCNFPPEYAAALNWCLARRLRASYQLPADPTVDSLARDALNTIRLASSAMDVLTMPRQLRLRNRSYDYRGDTNP